MTWGFFSTAHIISLLLGIGMIENGRFSVFDKESDYYSEQMNYPENKEISNLNHLLKGALFSRTLMVCDEKEERIVASCFGLMDFYSISEHGELSLIKANHYHFPLFETGANGSTIIYHKEDNDGIISAALVYYHLTKRMRVEWPAITMMPADYTTLNRLTDEEKYARYIEFHPNETIDSAKEYYVTRAGLDTSFIDDFFDRKEVIKTLTAFHIDLEKFIYLLLFINDVVEDACTHPPKRTLSQIEKVNEMVKGISEATQIITKKNGRKNYETQTFESSHSHDCNRLPLRFL